MHNRKLITLLAGTAAFAAAPFALAQTTDPSTGMNATSGSTRTDDHTMSPSGSPTTTSSSQSTTTTDTSTGTTTGTSTGTTGTATGTTGTSTTGTSPGTRSTTTGTSGSMTGTPGTTTGTTGTTTGTTGTTGTTYGNSTDMTAGSTGSTAGTANLQGTDATFLRRALEGGREEVRKAEAAMRNAQRAEVRNVASMMLEDHRRSNERLQQLATRKGWNLPAASDTAESDQSRRMGTGAAFDDNYLEDEIRHHRETIALYRAQASSGSDPDLRQFAQDALPSLEHHLQMLQGSLSAK